MTVLSLNTKQKYGSLLAGNTAYYPGDYESIASVTVVGSSTGNITFSSIPQTYQHLQLRIYARTTRPAVVIDNLWCQVNGSTNSGEYGYHIFYGDGTTTSFAGTATGSVSAVPMGAFPGDAANNGFGMSVIDIVDYTSTAKWKHFRGIGGFDVNTAQTARVNRFSWTWESLSAITSLSIDDQSGYNFSAGTYIGLYGIKG